MASNLPEIKNFKSLLQKYYGETIEIINFETKPLTTPGENYGSVMLAVDVTLKINDGTPEVKHFVSKLIPSNKMLCDMFNIQYTFKKEMNMYLEAIPTLQKFEQEFGIKENLIGDMFAKCFGGRINLNPGSEVVDNDACLLLENLKKTGYNCGDRLIGFDLAHAKMIIKNLAKFHAVPIALRILKPQVFDNEILPSLFFVKMGETFDDKLVENTIQQVVDVFKNEPKCVPYTNQVTDSIKHFVSGPYRELEPRQPFATIVHCDYWVNNTMILSDSTDKPIHNKIVDLQLPMYSSGVIDLLFFMFTSISAPVLYENIDFLLKLYYESFIKILTDYQIDISMFSWEAFQNELSIYAPLELGHILVLLKPLLTERGQVKEMSEISEDEMFRNDLTLAKDYQSRLINSILIFIERKWI